MPALQRVWGVAEFRAQVSGSSVAPAEVVNEKLTPQTDRATGDFPQRRADLHGMRRAFPDAWAGFLRAHFQTASRVAAFFDVDHRTARDWISGKHGATAPVALFAIQTIPGALAALTEDVA